MTAGILCRRAARSQGQYGTILANCSGHRRSTVEGGTLIGQVIATVKQRIASRTLKPGAQLPSIRSLAQTLQISKSTIVEAYERLAAEGIIRSRPGAGFF